MFTARPARTPRPGGRFRLMTTETTAVHGGRLVARRLAAHGVTKLFTLSGGHLFSVYDGCREEGIDIVDVRHEASAAFAAEGWAKVTRTPGVCALTAGPGVTNGMSALGSALQNHSPMLVLGGRAPAMRWGQGSLQEIDHVPFVRPLTRFAATAGATAEIPALIDEAWAAAVRPHSGPAFVDLPARPRVHGGARGGAGRGRAGRAARAAAARPRPRADAARRRRAAGDHGRHQPLLGPRGGRAARAGRGARDPGLPQRPRARVHPGRPRAVLLARAQHRAQGRRRRARRRRADGLPARLRQVVRRGHRDRRHRRRRARARSPARGRRRALRRRRRDPLRARGGRRRRRRASGSRRSAPPSARSARASASCAPTTARRCTRCACTPSSARCSTATRS